jgi:CHAT domain-containing protein
VSGQRVRVLLVADPTGDLPSAAQEGTSLKTALEAADVEVRLLLGAQATRTRILNAIDTRSVDALHFAGHGFFESADPAHGGLVCAGAEILRGSDLDHLGELPALVFFNACEAARVRRRVRRAPGARTRGRPTSVAEAFLAGGVANFIGTHWPVGDAAAGSFSTSLYTRLLAGADLGTAILGARRALSELGLPDWADYVHYGNPAFMPLASRNGPD